MGARASFPNWIKNWTPVMVLVVTCVYVALTFYMLREMKEQTTLTRSSYQETLRAFLALELSHGQFIGARPEAVTADVKMKNKQSTLAEVIHLVSEVYEFGMDRVSVRDSLLDTCATFPACLDILSGRFSKYIPPEDSFSYAQTWKLEESRVGADGTFFLHLLVLYRDVFGSYRDTYCTFKLNTNRNVRYIYPVYDCYDYSQKEAQKVLATIQREMARQE